MKNTPLLNTIAVDLVKEKVIEDKMKEYQQQGEEKNENIVTKKTQVDDFPEIDDVDSEEERIIQKEIEKRKEAAERSKEITKKKALLKYGQYREIIETEFLDTMLKNEKVVCHFYHNDFERCKIMDKHLQEISELHAETLFVRINAEKTPFFTNKLAIKVLPSVILFKNGKAYDRIVGFEDIGIKDDFPTINLIRRLVRAKIITAMNKSERGEISITKIDGEENAEEDLDI